jgi:ABC-2 type transport system permease protein
MMSENSSFSNFMALQKNITKRRKWLVVLAFVTYLLYNVGFLLLYLSSNIQAGLRRSALISEAATVPGPYSMNGIITAVGSVLLAIEGFRWLSNRQMLDFYESQPFSRNAHFIAVYVNSALILFLSHFTGTALGLLSMAAYRVCSVKAVESAFFCLGLDLTIFLAIFSVSALAVMLTGNLVVSVLATIVLLVFEPAFKMSLNFCMRLLPNFGGSGISYHGIFSPILSLQKQAGIGIPENLICAAIVTAAAFALYHFRKNEDAGKTVPLKAVRVIAKILLILLASLLIGVSCYGGTGTLRDSVIAIIISAVLIGGLMEAIYNSDIRKAFRGMGYTAIGCILSLAILLSCGLDFFGYGHWVPDKSQVVSAWIGPSGSSKFESKYMELTDIDAVNALLKAGENTEADEDTLYSVEIAYRMKNGKVKARNVSIPSSSEDLMKKIIDSKEFREGYFTVYHDEKIRKNLKTAYISYQNFDYSADAEGSHVAKNPKVYEKIRTAYLKDLEGYNYETEAYKSEIGEITVDLTMGGRQTEYCEIPVYQSFTNTIEVLKDNDLYVEPAELSEDTNRGGSFYVYPEKLSY